MIYGVGQDFGEERGTKFYFSSAKFELRLNMSTIFFFCNSGQGPMGPSMSQSQHIYELH